MGEWLLTAGHLCVHPTECCWPSFCQLARVLCRFKTLLGFAVKQLFASFGFGFALRLA